MHPASGAAAGRSEAREARRGGDGAEPTNAARELPIEKAFWHIFACATLWGFHVTQGQHGSYRVSLVKLAMFAVYAQGLLLWNAKAMAQYMESIYRGGLRAPRNRHFVAWLLLAVVVAVADSSIVICMFPVPRACRERFVFPVLMNSLFAFVFDLYMCVFIYTLRLAYERLNCRIKEVSVWSVAEVQEVGKTWLRLSRLLDEHNQTFEQIMHGRFSIFLAEIMCLLYTLATLSHTKNMPLALILPLMESLTLAMTLSLQESIIGNLCQVMLDLSHTADPLPCRAKYKAKARPCLGDHQNPGKRDAMPCIRISGETRLDMGSRQERRLRNGPNFMDDREVKCDEGTKEKYDKDVEMKGGEDSEPRHGSDIEVKDRGRDREGFTEVRDTETTAHWEKQKETRIASPCQDANVKIELKSCQEEEIKQGQSLGRNPGSKQRWNDCGPQCGCCQYHLNNIITRMEARPAVIKIWGQASLGRESFVYLAGLVMTYLVILLQLRPNQVP
ncbi:hypothetical protein C7M84_017426 [Penaeus vannamei]|uniref:Uncharacterized protein n=1 Tax=Penaeus vannamei TaxID=6689 RepID=A0A423SKC7_PENVA|nr:hypothetical protein C7M84_017426 [Penaeus vannamei]